MVSCLQGIIPGPNGPVEYIRVHYFSGETSRAFSEALRDAKGNGRFGIIVDLRNNPGILLHQLSNCPRDLGTSSTSELPVADARRSAVQHHLGAHISWITALLFDKQCVLQEGCLRRPSPWLPWC